VSEEEKQFCAEFVAPSASPSEAPSASSEPERACALTATVAAPGGVVGGRFRSEALAQRFGFADAAPVARAADEDTCWLAYVPPPRVSAEAIKL
jgi:hypothetical protein